MQITATLLDTDVLEKTKLGAYYSPGVTTVSKAIALDASKLPVYT